jgi:transcriptional antiterminator RfaH
MRRLRGKGIPHYGPMIERRTRSPAGRIQTAFVPLFPNYVFVFGDESTRYEALRTNCVARDLRVPDPTQLVADLRQIRTLIQTGLPLTPESQLETGVPVRIKSGPLCGQQGIVIRRRGECRLLVAVQFLQQGASLEVDHCDLEVLD